MTNLGKWLRKMRIDEGLNLKTFSEKMGYNSSAYISGIETGRKKPSRDFIRKFLDVFPQYKNEEKILNDYLKEQLNDFQCAKNVLDNESLVFAREINEVVKQINRDSDSAKGKFKKELEELLNKYRSK